MKKLCFFIIIALLIGLVITEQVLVSNTLSTINQDIIEIGTLAENVTTLEDTELHEKVVEVEEFWKERENYICFLVNHKNIEELGKELVNLKTAMLLDDKDAFDTSYNLIKYYTESYTHVMGISLQNIF